MKSEERRPGSLKWGLTLATLLCWILPIIIVTAVAAASLNYYYDRTIKQTADAGVENAMRQVELRLASAIEDSKAVSYEGIVRQAYRDYQHTHDRVGVYRTVTEYLSQKPSKMDEIDEALAAMTQKLEQLPPDEAEEHQAGNFIVNQAIAYIELHYREKLSLQEVADYCYISQWHLSKQLNKYAGKSFYDVLNSVRIKAAKQLLADPKLRIGDICEMVGYSDTAHFARTFKELEGVSANEYRNKLR